MNPEHKKYILENIGKKSIKNIAGDLHLKEKIIKRFLEKEKYDMKREKAEIIDMPAVIDNSTTKKRSNLVFILLIMIIGFAAYSNSFSNQFVWDDKLLIKNNKIIESFSNIRYIFSHELFQLEDEPTGYYRPMQTITYVMDYFLWKRNPSGYHITSFIIQILNSCLVFYLCLLVLKEQWKSFFIASIFCVHPAFVPIVAYISGRADLLGLFFALSSIFLIMKYIIYKKGKTALVLGIMLYPLAVISKEYYIIAPLFLLLYRYVFKDESKIGRVTKVALFCFLAISVIYIFLRLTVLNFHQKMGLISTLPFLTRVAFFPYVLTRYIVTLVFPINLGMEYHMIYSSLTEPRFIISYITPLLITIAIYHFYKKKQKNNLFFLGWFIVGIIPISNLFAPLKTLYADHWVYMASIGLVGLWVNMIDKLFSKTRTMRKLKIAFIIFPIVFFAALTYNENHYWRNDEVFFAHTYKKSPYHSRAQFNMAKIYEGKGEYEKALELYDKAIETSSGKDAYIFDSRAMLYVKMGNLEKARLDCDTAVKISPSTAVYHNNLGGVYIDLGMMNEGRAQLKEALKLDPNNELARKNLDLTGEQ